MLHTPPPPPPEHLHSLRKPNKSTSLLDILRNSFASVQSHVSIHPRFWLFATFLFIQVLVVFFTRTTPLSGLSLSTTTTTTTHQQPASRITALDLPDDADIPTTTGPDDPECPSGRVYVYDLPPMFNRDLIVSECQDLDPWNWQCGIVSNSGYGKPASELAGILPESLVPMWYRTNQFSSEVIFHERILRYKCRTLNPESATAYYIPFYAGLAVGKYLWTNDTAKRDWHCKMMLKWVENQTYWEKSKGSDHFITLGRITWDFRRLTDPEKLWGSSFLNMPEMEKVTHFTIEKAPGVYHEISIPYPTGLHPSSLSQLRQWQDFVRKRNRTKLFNFIGATREGVKNDFRSLLLSYCYNQSDACRVVDCALTQCSNGSLATLEALLDSEFCLQPRGDSFTRRAVFDCMLAGSIPVFFWRRTAYDQYEWHLPGEAESYSVFIDHEEVRSGRSIRKVLEKYSKKKVRRMREKVIEAIPRIIYSRPGEGSGSFEDAFDIAIDGVLRRIDDEKEWAAR